jgi:hypothetical protein
MSDRVWAHVVYEGVDYLIATSYEEQVHDFIRSTMKVIEKSGKKSPVWGTAVLKDCHDSTVAGYKQMCWVPGGSSEEIPLNLVVEKRNE